MAKNFNTFLRSRFKARLFFEEWLICFTVLIFGASPTTAIGSLDYVGCTFELVRNPVVYATPVGFQVQDNPSASECITACLKDEFAQAGISGGKFCLCGDKASAPDSTECTSLCSDGETCGNVNNVTVFSRYDTGGGSKLDFTFSATYSANSSHDTLELEMYSNLPAAHYDVNFGSSQAWVTVTTNATFYSLGAMGLQTATVCGYVPGGPDFLCHHFSYNAVNVYPKTFQTVCPKVSEPGKEYLCNVSLASFDDNSSFTGEFFEGPDVALAPDNTSLTGQVLSGPTFLFQDFASAYVHLGNMPPQGWSRDAVQGIDGNSEIILDQHPLTFEADLVSYEFYIHPLSGDVDPVNHFIEIRRPLCISGKEYCVSVGGCMTVCPNDGSNTATSCSASDVFCPFSQTCAASDPQQTCPAPEANPVWNTVLETKKSLPFSSLFQRIAFDPPIAVYPGDVIAAKGPFGRSKDVTFSGDLVNGQRTNFHQFVSAVVRKKASVYFSRICTRVSWDNYLSVVSNAEGVGLFSNPTSCERVIQNISMKVAQIDTDLYNSSLNLMSPYFIRSNDSAELLAVFSVAGPLNVNFTFNPAPNNTSPYHMYNTSDFPLTGTLHELLYTLSLPDEGTHQVTVSAWNNHNDPTGPLTGTPVTLIVQHPVHNSWQVSRTSDFYVLPMDYAQIVFNDITNSKFPSSALITIDWGDTIETVPFIDPGNQQPQFNHLYVTGGTYNVSIRLYNKVSHTDLLCALNIIETIQNFSMSVMIPSEPGSDILYGGMGPLKNEFPVDTNLSFIPFLVSGTVDNYEVYVTNNESLITNSSEITPHNPSTAFIHRFTEEGYLGIGIKASNSFEFAWHNFTIHIFGVIRNMVLDDHSVITSKNEPKIIIVKFEKVALKKSCLVLNWGDGVIEGFGDRDVCHANYSDVIVNNVTLKPSLNLTHVYAMDGQFSIFAVAFNNRSVSLYNMHTLVATLNCNPPIVDIAESVQYAHQAREIKRSEAFTVTADAELNCNLTHNNTKKWEIFAVNASADDALIAPVIIENTLRSWNTSALNVPARFLEYGYYKLIFTIKMNDSRIRQEWKPLLERSVYTFVKVIMSELNAVAVENSVSRVARGPTQWIHFNPMKYSINLDYPDDKDFRYRWRCRQLGETYPNITTDISHPVTPQGMVISGCFGYGPGLLKYDGGSLSLSGLDFVSSKDVTYEMEVTISKDDGREATAVTHVHLIADPVPLVNIRCVVESLCITRFGKIYINPSYRLGVVADCNVACDPPLMYEWVVADANDQPFVYLEEYFPVGIYKKELALSEKFLSKDVNMSEIHLSVQVQNNKGNKGEATFYLFIPKSPRNGVCTYYGPSVLKSLVENVTIVCTDWQDPEGVGIDKYQVIVTSEGQPEKVMNEVQHRSSFPNEAVVILSPGTYNISVRITNKWGTFSKVTVTEGLQVVMPSQEEFEQLQISSWVKSLTDSGNVALATMILGTQSAITGKAEWLKISNMIVENGTSASRAVDQMVINVAEQNNEALSNIIENTNFVSLSSVESASTAVASIMETASSKEASKTIDIAARDKVINIMENMMNSLETVDIPSSGAMQTLAQNILTASAGIMIGLSDVGTKEKNCSSASAADLKTADSLEYDTSLPDDINFEVPKTPEAALRCNVKGTVKNNAIEQTAKIDQMLTKLSKNIMEKCVVGEDVTITSPNGMAMTVSMMDGKSLGGTKNIGNSGAKIAFPKNFCPAGSCDNPVTMSAKEWPSVTNAYAKNAEALSPNSHVLDIEVFTRDLDAISVSNLEKPIEVILTRSVNEGELPEPVCVNATQESSQLQVPIIYSNVNVSREKLAVNLEITPDDVNDRLFMIISHSRMPTLRNHDFFQLITNLTERNGTYDWFLSSSALKGSGRYFVGIGQFDVEFDVSLMKDPIGNGITNDILQNITTDYTLRIFTSGCYFFDKELLEWSSNGMEVVYADYFKTKCQTTHLTSFSSGFFVAPNSIDFSYVFANMGFADNLTINITLILCLATLLCMMVWARLKDKKDLTKLGASPMTDNKAEDKYLYEMMVFTGDKVEAQTDSVVQFILSGEDDETDIRVLEDSTRKILQKGAVDIFIMAVPRPLGSLEFLRIWHDNSGKGPNASWYLSYIVLKDLQTGDKFTFVAEKWFGIEKGDGEIDKLITVAGKEQMTNFTHLFNVSSSKSFTDGHLWFSVFLRPPRSRFTRCQRLGSCFALLYLSMVVNAMWYQTVPESPGTGGLQLGPFSLSPEQIGVGVMSNLIIFIPSLIIVQLFRKARPRTLRKSRVQEALEKTRKIPSNKNQTLENETIKRPLSSVTTSSDAIIKRRKKKSTLPWWTRIIAWILVWVCILASITFVYFYGISFGNTKATKWVTSLVISFFSSVLFVQPIKIVLVTLFVSLISKPDNLDDDDADEDEEDPELESDEAWLHPKVGGPRESKMTHKKTDPVALQRHREQRQKELEMHAIIKELLSYFIFLWLLYILSYGNRNPNDFYLNQSLMQSFINEDAIDESKDFTKVTDTSALWNYFMDAFLEALRTKELYNGAPPLGLKGFFKDTVNRILGYATIRQIRTKENTCRLHPLLEDTTMTCADFTNLVDEDHEDYCEGWIPLSETNKKRTSCRVDEYKYISASTLSTLPVWGTLDTYGAGGYVIRLKASNKNLKEKFTRLMEQKWIDHRTRAVIIDFASYNAQVNLFGVSRLLAEFTPGGGIIPSYRFDGIQLLSHNSGFGLFVVICEVSFVLLVVYCTVREARCLYRGYKKYFSSYWSYAEIAIILVSYSAIIVYILRYIATQKVLKIFSETLGNGYISLQHAAFLDEVYGYLTSFLVFVGTIKIIKVLRFNKRMGILAACLCHCWNDLKGYLLAMSITFLAFAGMFHLLLGSQLLEFKNFVFTFETCFSMLLGKFEFQEMKEVSPLSPVMFFIFTLVMSWVILNLFFSVIIQAFEEVKNTMTNSGDYKLVPFMLNRVRSFLGLGTCMQSAPIHGTVSAKSEGTDIVDEFPEKIDKFLTFIDQVYFDGRSVYGKKASVTRYE